MTGLEVSAILRPMFSSYVERPTNCRFEGQDADEEILLLLRAHPITNLPWIILAVLVFMLPFIALKLVPSLGFNPAAFGDSILIVFLTINYLVVLVIAFEGFLSWYFNVIIVTDKNIVDVDFYSLLFKNIDMAPLRNVVDTSSSMGGILRAIFHYGDVFIQTAGTARNFELYNVPRPHQVADFILDEVHKIYGKGDHA